MSGALQARRKNHYTSGARSVNLNDRCRRMSQTIRINAISCCVETNRRMFGEDSLSRRLVVLVTQQKGRYQIGCQECRREWRNFQIRLHRKLASMLYKISSYSSDPAGQKFGSRFASSLFQVLVHNWVLFTDRQRKRKSFMAPRNRHPKAT